MTASIATCTTAAEIQQTLALLDEQDRAITRQLDTLVASQRDLARQLAKLDLARAQLSPQVVSIRTLSNGMLSSASSTATRISSAVKALDTEQAAVKSTLEVVRQVAELKACVLGLHASMGAQQDWETAATYLSRARKIPHKVLTSAFADQIVPTAEIPEPPAITLHTAAESLCVLFLREFDSAARSADGVRVTRFFKLFPLIGRDAVGLDAYGRYVCAGVGARARLVMAESTGNYPAALTRLFEHVAQIVDGHEPVVTRHYGPGTMGKVIARLQVEADVQGGLVLDSWADERHLARTITQVKSYAFSFLVQSFLKRGESDAQESEDVDMKLVDALLAQMALMLGRWALYTRFIGVKLEEPEPALVLHSSLQKKITDTLVDPFNILSTFFVRRSVEKSFQLDEQPELHLNLAKPLPSPPYITSVVDDVMYIVSQVIQRALGTSVRSVASVIPAIARVLGSDFYGMIQRRMRDESYPKATHGPPQESIVVSFIVLTNNLDVSGDYVKRIVSDAVTDDEQVKTMLQDLQTGFQAKTTDLINEAVVVLRDNVIRPRLRPVVIEAFQGVDYKIDEEQDVIQRFERGWTTLMQPIKRICTERNYERILKSTIQHLARLLEKRIWTFYEKVDRLGAARLERDVTGVVQVAVQGGRYDLRDQFARCTQMVMVLNMDQEELDTAEVEWRLGADERANVRAMLVG